MWLTWTATSAASSSVVCSAADPHPNADKLQLCHVDVGNPELQQIVCGAWNFGAARRSRSACRARCSRLPGPLEERELRGQGSQGMILAEDEVGLGSDHAGSCSCRRARARHAARRRLAAERPCARRDPDHEPRRPLSMVGLARRVARSVMESSTRPTRRIRASRTPSWSRLRSRISRAAPRYIGRVFRNVAVGASPQWLRTRLHLAGMRSISNVVDVTNYVMHVWGSPLHAFDRARLADGRIVVRRARDGGGAAEPSTAHCGSSSRPT